MDIQGSPSCSNWMSSGKAASKGAEKKHPARQEENREHVTIGRPGEEGVSRKEKWKPVNAKSRGAGYSRLSKPHTERPQGRRELLEFTEPRKVAENSQSLSLSSEPWPFPGWDRTGKTWPRRPCTSTLLVLQEKRPWALPFLSGPLVLAQQTSTQVCGPWGCLPDSGRHAHLLESQGLTPSQSLSTGVWEWRQIPRQEQNETHVQLACGCQTRWRRLFAPITCGWNAGIL